MFTRLGKNYRVMRSPKGHYYVEYEHKGWFWTIWWEFKEQYYHRDGTSYFLPYTFTTTDDAIDFLQIQLWPHQEPYEVI